MLLAIMLIATTVLTLTAVYLTNAQSSNASQNNDMQTNSQQVKSDDRISSAALAPQILFSTFQVDKTIADAQTKAVQFKIKAVPQSLLPADYQLVGVITNPLGPETKDPFSGKTFRPQNVVLYYWNKPIDSNMDINKDFFAGGGIIIDEMYALGANSTAPYYPGVTNRPFTTTVGWFKGYPGVWDNGYAEVFNFDQNMSYRVWGNSLTVEQELAMIQTLLEN